MTATILNRLNREQMAWRAAQDIAGGAYVNLGIGMPEMVANHVTPERQVVFHSENGILGLGPVAAKGAEDFDLVTAGKKPATVLPGAAYFDSALSFAMIRGGHLDIAVLGAFQVSRTGDLANWSTGNASVTPAVGGAMDLAQGARRVFVLTTHTDRDGAPKIVEACTYPLTATAIVTTVYTDLAVIDITPDGPVVRELIGGLDMDGLQALTGPRLTPAADFRVLTAPVL
ncbi:MAG: 3-oxoacid CoA-transferase subunit B [Rhodospirillales bacterium]|nr:3-oxoacid CoA-transferase subunit B [Rhodospirillales bacterium]